MAELASTEAPLKRKPEGNSEAAECKKLRECVPLDTASLENLQEAPGNHNSALVNPLEEIGANTTEGDEEASKNDGNSARNGELKLSAEAPGSSSEPLQGLETIGEGEVFAEDEGDEDDDGGELSELDTENDSEDDEEDEDAGSDDDEDGSDGNSDNEEEEEHMLTSTSSSLQAESARKGKGKEKMDDVKGKGIMALDKGKGKVIAEDETAPVSDEDDAGYLSEDPLEEVDLNNILPSRTRKRSSTHHYDFVDHGDDEDDEDDDSDA